MVEGVGQVTVAEGRSVRTAKKRRFLMYLMANGKFFETRER